MQGILAGALGFAAYVVLVAVSLRIATRASPAKVALILAFLAYAILLAVVVVLAPPVKFWALSTTYWFLVTCFLMIFGAVFKSVSLRILGDLLNEPCRAATGDAIARYVEKDSFADRLDVMVKVGFARLTAAGYELTPKGIRVASVMHWLHRVFMISKSG